MPAFIAHFLIAKDVFEKAALPKEHENFFVLGSVGPDLPYYRDVVETAVKEFIEDRFNPDSPGAYKGYGDYFHARTVNVFPMMMLETVRKDKDDDPAIGAQKLAYVLGYLTHVAADQHVHPFVERYAGPYYRSGTCRKKHRLIEVYEDILLHERLTGNLDDFTGTDFRSWFDISEEREEEEAVAPVAGVTRTEKVVTRVSTPDWFGPFIQRAFFESYSTQIDDDEADKWVKGFGSVFGFLNRVGPYHDALKNLKDNDSEEAREMRAWFDGPKLDYVPACFGPAKEVAARYVAAGREFFEAKEISDSERERFRKAVPDADLTSPLAVI